MNKFSTMKFAAVFAVTLLVSACASTQPSRQQSKSVEVVKPAESRSDGSVRFDTENEQVARLWIAAENARNEKRNAIALELIFDALEINPRNSMLLSRAAELQLDSLEAALAESYAVKSNSLAGDNQALLYRNWLIIEHARSMRGDLLGVRSAHKEVQRYRYQ